MSLERNIEYSKMHYGNILAVLFAKYGFKPIHKQYTYDVWLCRRNESPFYFKIVVNYKEHECRIQIFDSGETVKYEWTGSIEALCLLEETYFKCILDKLRATFIDSAESAESLTRESAESLIRDVYDIR